MKNKVFVKIMVPEIDKSFDVYLPVNKKIGNILLLLNKAISEITNDECVFTKHSTLYNKMTKEKYDFDVLLINTNIRNGTTLILLS